MNTQEIFEQIEYLYETFKFILGTCFNHAENLAQGKCFLNN